MRKVLMFSASVVVGVLVSGCASLSTFNKSVEIGNESLAIDAKQRVIIAKKKPGGGGNGTVEELMICAEPSPDALSVIGASGGLSVSNPTGVGGSTSSAFAEAAASIGLRTQSITTLRDQNYRVCEAYANGAIEGSEVAGLMRRNQSSIMGLVAIEQLTGPVVASQVALSAAMSASTGSSSDAEVTAARTDAKAAQEAELKAETDLDTSKIAHEKNVKAVQSASNKLSAAQGADNPDATVIEGLESTLSAAQDAADLSEADVADKRRRLETAKEQNALAAGRLAMAESGKTSASGASSAVIAELAKANTASATEVAKEVGDIVSEINASYMRDGCFALLSKIIDNPQFLQMQANKVLDPKEKALLAALNACTAIMAVNPTPNDKGGAG